MSTTDEKTKLSKFFNRKKKGDGRKSLTITPEKIQKYYGNEVHKIGFNLAEQCVVQNSKIPFLIIDCVNWIKSGNRIKIEGIFRKRGRN